MDKIHKGPQGRKEKAFEIFFLLLARDYSNVSKLVISIFRVEKRGISFTHIVTSFAAPVPEM